MNNEEERKLWADILKYGISDWAAKPSLEERQKALMLEHFGGIPYKEALNILKQHFPERFI